MFLFTYHYHHQHWNIPISPFYKLLWVFFFFSIGKTDAYYLVCGLCHHCRCLFLLLLNCRLCFIIIWSVCYDIIIIIICELCLMLSCYLFRYVSHLLTDKQVPYAIWTWKIQENILAKIECVKSKWGNANHWIGS